jgi:nitrate reductase cytochrome c-type subunit
MHTPYSSTRYYSEVGTFTPTYSATWPAFFTGGRTPTCETCHNNSIEYYGSGDSVLKTAVHYGKYTNLTTIGVSDENTTSCAQCHREGTGITTTQSERLTWGVDDNLGKSGGYLNPNKGNLGTGFDMFGTGITTERNYCWGCHIVQNVEKTPAQSIDPPQFNFHNAEVTGFNWNCNSCH